MRGVVSCGRACCAWSSRQREALLAASEDMEKVDEVVSGHVACRQEQVTVEVQGSRLRAQGPRLRVQGSGFGAHGVRVQGLGHAGSGLRARGSGFRVQGFTR